MSDQPEQQPPAHPPQPEPNPAHPPAPVNPPPPAPPPGAIQANQGQVHVIGPGEIVITGRGGE